MPERHARWITQSTGRGGDCVSGKFANHFPCKGCEASTKTTPATSLGDLSTKLLRVIPVMECTTKIYGPGLPVFFNSVYRSMART